jgi:hypothetical protein
MMPKLRQPYSANRFSRRTTGVEGDPSMLTAVGGGEKSAAEVEVALGDDRLLPVRREGLPLGVREGSSVL